MSIEAYNAWQDKIRNKWMDSIPPHMRAVQSAPTCHLPHDPAEMPEPPAEICGQIRPEADLSGELRLRRAVWIWRRKREGWSQRSIAARLGVTGPAVGQAIRGYDPRAVPLVAPSHLRGPKPWRDRDVILERDEWVGEAVAEGRSRNEIAAALRITPGAVAAILKRGPRD